jgi:hypothetical protein
MAHLIAGLVMIGLFVLHVLAIAAGWNAVSSEPTLWAYPLAIVFSTIPVGGSILATLGAIQGWGWDWWWAAALFLCGVPFSLFGTKSSREVTKATAQTVQRKIPKRKRRNRPWQGLRKSR